MTVLGEGGDFYAPPHKRPCLSYHCPVVEPYQMATPLDAGVMLNGYGLVDSHKNHSPDDSSANSEGVSPVATLCNLGNTCFLNSVLYTLRFAPAFLHNLHHLALDLVEYSGRYSHLKVCDVKVCQEWCQGRRYREPKRWVEEYVAFIADLS